MEEYLYLWLRFKFGQELLIDQRNKIPASFIEEDSEAWIRTLAPRLLSFRENQ
jgi:hypothetical protein